MILELALITLAYSARLTEGAVAPLSIPSSTSFYSWYGKDGNWSAVTVEVGSPPQRVQLIPSTDSTELWAVLSLGCDDGDTACAQSRGGLFNQNQSHSWKQIGYYDVFSDQREVTQGLSLTGLYGTDTIQLTSNLALENHIMAGFMNQSIYAAGVFGLGPENTTFDGATEYSSLVGSLFSMGKIPSLSWSFTAGAYYREKGVLCQVLLGGYDLKRYDNHGISFSLTPELKPLAAMDKLTVDGDDILGDVIEVYIDSTTPYLWLPTSVCDSIAGKVGLRYDDGEKLYFYNDYDATSKANHTFSFALKNSSTVTNDVVTLELPFAAFDLWHQFENGSSTRYFPLKRAGKAVEYTLGRSFLQETYLIVDYNRVNFTIAQAKFDGNTGSTQDIHTISDVLLELNSTAEPTALTNPNHPKSTNGAGSSSGKSHKKLAGIIAGSVIGGLILIALLLAGAVLLLRTHRRRALQKEMDHAAPTFPDEAGAYATPGASAPMSPVEIAEASPKAELAGGPVPTSFFEPQELDALEKVEMDSSNSGYDRSATAALAAVAMAEERSGPQEKASRLAEAEMAAQSPLPDDDKAVFDEKQFRPLSDYDDGSLRQSVVDDDDRRWLRASATSDGSAAKLAEQQQGINRPTRSRNGKSDNILENPFFRLNMKQ